MKTYIVVMRLKNASGTQRVRVTAENGDHALHNVYAGAYTLIDQDLVVDFDDLKPISIEEAL